MKASFIMYETREEQGKYLDLLLMVRIHFLGDKKVYAQPVGVSSGDGCGLRCDGAFQAWSHALAQPQSVVTQRARSLTFSCCEDVGLTTRSN